MSVTSQEVNNVFQKALEIVDCREDCYFDRWKKEPIRDLIGNASRKVDGLEYQIRKNLVTNVDKFKEDILDSINYLAFSYKLIEIRGSIDNEE